MTAVMLLSLIPSYLLTPHTARAEETTYSFPEAELNEAQTDAIVETLNDLLDGEVALAYRLAGDLYYVIISQDDTEIGGAVVREGRQNGQIMYHILQTDEALLPEDELLPYISQAAGTPNITINFNEAAQLTTLSESIEYLENAIRNTDGTTPNDAALSEIAAYIQYIIGTQATATLAATDNRLMVADIAVQEAADTAQQAYDEFVQVLSQSSINLGRSVAAVIRAEGQNIDLDEAAQITFNETLSDMIGDSSIMVLLGDNRHSLTITSDDLKTLTDQYGSLTVQIERNSDGVYIIAFIDSDNDLIERLSAPVTIMLPATGRFDTVFAGFADDVENWGGQFDGLASTIQFTTPFSGSYEVLENLMEIADIEDLPDDMQNAVRFMVSKGFFNLSDGMFNPNDELTRYDFSATLVRMFFALDRSLDTSFADVQPDSEYYSYIASGEHEGLIEGIGENRFAGERIMTRQEAVTVSVRALTNKRDYAYPTNTDEYIALFSDADEIAEWAKNMVALAVREGIVDRNPSFEPLAEITRSETALIMYKLFLLLYEAPPVEIKMSPLSETAVNNVDPIRPSESTGSPFTLILIMIIGFVLFCLIMIACAFYGIYLHKKKRSQKEQVEEPAAFVQDGEIMPGTFGAEFTDTAFCREIMRILNSQDGGERMPSSEITEDDYQTLDVMTVLNLRKKQIKSLKGLEHFTSLTRLDCASNQLTELDVSQNTMLRQLLCFNNQLSELDVSKNEELLNLYCYNNQLAELDMSNNLALETLNCANNLLTKFDMLRNTELKGFHCFSNYMDPNPDESVPGWNKRWSTPGTSWDGSAFQFFPQKTME